jgi:hypothetical protein
MIIDCWKQTVRDEGHRGLWKGFGPCVGRAFPANAAGFLTYEWTTKLLKGEPIFDKPISKRPPSTSSPSLPSSSTPIPSTIPTPTATKSVPILHTSSSGNGSLVQTSLAPTPVVAVARTSV